LTGKYFVALSPHLTLLSHPNRSGLRENFVSATNISDQLSPFASFHNSFEKVFDGTVVRIPLRTAAQAEKSKIIDLAITPQELLDHFAAFQNEVVESLPFLKYVEKVEFRVDGTHLGGFKIMNVGEIRQARATFIDAINNSEPVSVTMRMDIKHTYAHGHISVDTESRYLVKHQYADLEQYDGDEMEALRALIHEEKYYPWVALAAPLNAVHNCEQRGRVFVTLPLPVRIDNTQVNVHGIFALSRDRRSLWTPADSQSGGPAKEIAWNTFLFLEIIPRVWNDLLVELARTAMLNYSHFPLTPASEGNLFGSLAKDVLERVFTNNSPVWRSLGGTYLALSEGFIVTTEIPKDLLAVVRALDMPLVMDVPVSLVQMILESKHRYDGFSPSSARGWLRAKLKNPLLQMTPETATVLLRYVLSDKSYGDLYELPLFYCRDGRFRAIQPRQRPFTDFLYIGSDDVVDLFRGMGPQFVNLTALSQDVREQLQKELGTISKVLGLQRFGPQAFRLFAVHKNPSWCSSSDCKDVKITDLGIDHEWLQRLWNWLDKYEINDLAKAIDGMFLIPLQNGNIRMVSTIEKATNMSRFILRLRVCSCPKDREGHYSCKYIPSLWPSLLCGKISSSQGTVFFLPKAMLPNREI